MSNSIQHILERVRAPRVKITYDVQIGNAIEKKEIPFVIGVLADLSGHNSEKPLLSDRKFVEIDRDNFDDVLASCEPYLKYSVPNLISGAGTIAVQLNINSIDDFTPSNILRAVPQLNDLYASRIKIVDLMSKLDGNDALDDAMRQALTAKKLDNIDDVVKNCGLGLTEDQATNSKGMLQEFSNFLAKEQSDITPADPYLYLTKIIQRIDEKLSLQMDEILHNRDFLALEGVVRGLSYLVKNSETGESLKIRILNLSKDEMFKDLEKAVEFDQSKLFKKIYEEEYGTFGGKPYSCLVGAFDFDSSPQDIEMLRKMSGIAAASHAPFLTAANARMFGMESFGNMSAPRDLKKLFESSEFIKWNGFRETEDARYVALLLPRVLMRQVYRDDLVKVDEFRYDENVISENGENGKFCWGNPAFVMAHRIADAFSQYGWTAAIRGFEGGGAVTNLPVYTFRTDEGDIAIKCPTEVSITDRREKELSDLGFLALCHRKGTDIAVFFGSQTVQKAKQYQNDDANANAMISARLPYLLNASRFAHYIKIMMRDKIGSFSDKEEIRSYLQDWLANYILLSDVATQSSKARFPLREGRVDVVDEAGKPGDYRAVIFLRPHFQLEGLTVSMRLVAKLPAAA